MITFTPWKRETQGFIFLLEMTELAVVREQDENRFSSKRKWVGVPRRSKTLIRKKVNHARINNIGLSLQRLDVIGINKYFNI